MNAKVIEHWTDSGFNVVITALFETDGIDIGEWVTDYRDCVWLNFCIYDPTNSELYSFVQRKSYAAYSHTKKEKTGFLKKKKTEVSISQAYEERMIKIKEIIESMIESSLNADKLNRSDQQITDGLPDSLKSIK